MNKNNIVLLAVLLSLSFSVASAQRTETGRQENGGRQIDEPNRHGKVSAGESPKQKKHEESIRKKEMFQEKHRRYLDDAKPTESRVYRKSKEGSEIPKSRYEEFEQKRERHRKYNEYIERLNQENPVDEMRENNGGESYRD